MILFIFLIPFISSCGGSSTDIQSSSSDHSNILTSWASKRTEVLVKKEKAEHQAIVQAENELDNIFGIKHIHKLDTTQYKTYPQDNALLLLLKGALEEVAKKHTVEPQRIIDDIALDFSDNGFLTEKGDDWFLRMQALIRDNPQKHLDMYAKSNKSSDSPKGDSLPLLIPLASRPSAIAPKEIFAELGETITLDGSASHDSTHGNIINYTWFRVDQKQGFVVPLIDRFSDSPNITVPNKETELLFALVVTDEQKLTDTTVVKVIIRKPEPKNNPPIADPQSVETDEDIPVNIHLTGSDADNDSINFVINTPILLPHGILDGTPPNLTYTPTKNFFGTDSFTFKVNDGSEDSSFAKVGITVNPVNDTPVANAGADQKRIVGSTIILNGSASSDIDGDYLLYAWSFTSVPTSSYATLNTPTSIQSSFTIDTPGTYIAQLIVNDGQADSIADTVTIITQNTQPIAVSEILYPLDEIHKGNEVVLSGNDSYDPDGDPITYHWSLLAPDGNELMLNNPNEINTSFLPEQYGVYKASLIVNDSVIDSNVSNIDIVVVNQAPTADAGKNKTAYGGEQIILSGSGIDPEDGSNITFEWTAPAGIALSESTSSNPSFIAPYSNNQQPTELEFSLIVKDTQGLASSPSTVIITVY